MATKIFSCFVDGLTAKTVEVEVDILQGLPGLSIVGLGDTAVQEAKERIRSAIKNSGGVYPQQKKIINLAPAHLRKNGACFDLPMALGLLVASEQLKAPQGIFVGELALNGEIRPVKAALSIALFAQKQNVELFIPYENAFEVSITDYQKIYPVKHLSDLMEHFRGTKMLETLKPKDFQKKLMSDFHENSTIDVNMIQGQALAKRALEISAAGGHHLLMYGPPGTGKTLLAQALQGLLPPLAHKEVLEVLEIYSAAGLLINVQNNYETRPFRQVHQSCSLPALIGGGSSAAPGEISLAHHGVLFFDEIAEARRPLLESLRQPLEERRITISRLHRHVTYPANFTLVAAMNPCPCGYYGNQEKHCTCSNNAIIQYHKKLSGPLLDRFDLFLQIHREPMKLHQKVEGKCSREIQKNIMKARKKQFDRYKIAENKDTMAETNSQMKPQDIEKYCKMEPETENLFLEYCNKAKISARSFHKILKVSRTIADLNDHDTIMKEDMTEAFTYRFQPTSPLV